MAANRKYYYMRLKENFFDEDAMKVMEGMQEGYLYSNVLLKMYLASLKYGGRMMLNGVIPYTPEMIATVTRHQVGTVERALRVFQQLGLIEILDNGAIYMLDIQNFIGKSSTEADRVREYERKIEAEKTDGRKHVEIYEKSTPEIERELNTELYLYQETDKPQGGEKKVPKELEAAIQMFDADGTEISPALQEALQDFIEMRKKIKKPLTAKAILLNIKALRKLAVDEETQIAIINQSVQNSWQGFYALKENSYAVKDIQTEDPEGLTAEQRAVIALQRRKT